MYKKILVPLDRSPEAEAVLPVAARLARADGAVVRLLHVAPNPVAVLVEGGMPAYVDQEIDRLRYEALDYLRGAASRLAGVPVEFAVHFGDPADEIIEEAKEFGADLIAMATHGRTGLARVVLGSVAEKILRTAPGPVLAIRHGEQAPEEASPPAPEAAPRTASERHCLVCGKPSQDRICDPCKARIRGEALGRKLEDEKAGRKGSPA
jgi:nucleotide-binding universal stress UspA family protein